MQHASLENGRWAQMTFPQQMANIGSETSRTLKALEAGKDTRAEGAFARAQELIDLTIRFRELFCAAVLSRDLKELASLNRYLDQFAMINPAPRFPWGRICI